jgi:predicted ATP-dependent endonuclease of OLD family
MKLISARVTNYKLIHDTGEFRVDGLTCLVGKNESGKTAILKALHRLKPDDRAEAAFDVETEYPRHELFDYESRHNNEPDVVITTTWEAGADETEWIRHNFGDDVLVSTTVVVSKGYGSGTFWTVQLDEERAVNNLVDGSELDSIDAERLRGVKTVAQLVADAASLEASPRVEAFRNHLAELTGERTLWKVVVDHLGKVLPTFVYYASYHALPGQVSLNQLVDLESRNELGFPQKVFRALLSLVGANTQSISEAKTYEALKAKLEAIGLKLSREIFEYWSQNRDLEVEFNFDQARPGDPAPYDQGYIFRTRIKNTRHGVSVSFDERSTGFVWFFSFLVWFSQMEREHGDQLILLLDEPGLSLHGTAQADLLRYINEKLVPKYQVIYTTHSPFMIDSTRLLSVRTVEDVTRNGEVLGTKVGDDVLSTDAETLFPLRAALGYDITQTLFVGEHNLLVEGPADLLFIQWASQALKARGRTSLDRRWTVVPSGGVGKVASFLSLFSGHKLHVAVFTDLSTGIKSTVRSLRENSLLREGHVLTADMFVEGQDEADVEDLLGRRVYIEIVNKAYSLSNTHRLKAQRASEAPERVVKEVEEHFKLLPANIDDFDHFRPAVYLLEHSQAFDEASGVEVALDNFETLFEMVNSFLDQDGTPTN